MATHPSSGEICSPERPDELQETTMTSANTAPNDLHRMVR
jgi:hypothetical protein